MEITQQMSKYQREIQRFFGKKRKRCCLKTLIIDLSTQFLVHLWHGPGLFWCWIRDLKPELSRSCVNKQCSTTIGSKQTFLTWSNCPIGTMHPKLMTTKGMSPLWPGRRRHSKYNTQFLFWNKRREVSRDVKVRLLQINNCAFMTMEGNEDHLNLL